jgi:hypothetical protein
MQFFNGEGFLDCADMFGMSLYERRKILELVRTGYVSTVRVPNSTAAYFKVAYVFSPQHPELRS